MLAVVRVLLGLLLIARGRWQPHVSTSGTSSHTVVPLGFISNVNDWSGTSTLVQLMQLLLSVLSYHEMMMTIISFYVTQNETGCS